MPSKKRLVRKMVHPWFQNYNQEVMTDSLFDFMKDFEQEFVDWLLNALRESENVHLREELLKDKTLDRSTLRDLLQLRLSKDEITPEDKNAYNYASDNDSIDFASNAELGTVNGGNQFLPLKNASGSNGDTDSINILENEESLLFSTPPNYNRHGNLDILSTYSPPDDSLKWFIEDGKGTVRKKPSGRGADCYSSNSSENGMHRYHYGIQELFREFQKQQSNGGISEAVSRENLIDTKGSHEDLRSVIEQTDDEDLDKTLVADEFSGDSYSDK